MRKILFILICASALLLGGCKLAVADDETAQGRDVLCGVFVTLEPIHPAPAETTIDVPVNWNGNLNDVLFNEEDSRIYATRHENDNGSVDYTFNGVVGYRMFSITEKNPNGEENYNEAIGDEGWQDVSSNYGVTDNGGDIKLSGTLCFDVHCPIMVFTNPVYQTADGRVYCTYGNGYDFNSPEQRPGECGSTKISATATETVDGKETSRSLEAVVKYACANTNKQIVLKQMDSDDKVIDQTVITPGNIPESISVLPDTMYMILEEHSLDFSNKEAVIRTLINTDAETFNVRFTGENGIVESHPVMMDH